MLIKRISLDLPVEMIDKIDKICDEYFISRRKWFIDAANEKLEREIINKIDRIVNK